MSILFSNNVFYGYLMKMNNKLSITISNDLFNSKYFNIQFFHFSETTFDISINQLDIWKYLSKSASSFLNNTLELK